jgi:hypothetical protein
MSHVAGSRLKWLLTVGLEALLISVGVFLGLMGEQWRENADRRERAETALVRIRAEVTANRASIAAGQKYHSDLKESLEAYLAAKAAGRPAPAVHMSGLNPAFFEHSAWDLAFATQSLADIEPDLAFTLSQIYTAQETYAGLSDDIVQALYLRPPWRARTQHCSSAPRMPTSGTSS